MRDRRRLAALAALLWTGGLLPAVEPVVADLRLLAEAGPTAYRYEWESARGSAAGDDHLQRSLAVGAGWRWAAVRPGQRLGLLLGAEALVRSDRIADGRRLGGVLRGECGLAAGLGNRLVLCAGPVVGGGFGRWNIEPATAPGTALDGREVEAGVRAGLRWTPGRSWGVAGEGGWWWSRELAEGDGARMTIRRSGPAVALALSWTLDPVMRRLE